jgi:UDP-N-acetylglucosamine 2-epimerase (non-hydrolysing)
MASPVAAQKHMCSDFTQNRPPVVLSVFGTRPEAIKMAPVARALSAAGFAHSVCVTGQHRHLLDQVLRIFDIEPQFDLGIMQPNQDLYDISSKVLLGMREILEHARPDLVLVHGDTTTASMGALAAFYAGIDIGHVEAGLRTYDIRSPFPEEFNRQLVGRLARLHFAPTTTARDQLLAEGVASNSVIVTGNTAIDALFIARAALGATPDSRRTDVLVTAHRRENFGEGIRNICVAVKRLAQKFEGLSFLYPVHPNPNICVPVHQMLQGVPNVHLVQPLDYLEFVQAMGSARLILSDSGGVQEEAPALGKPVLVLRDVTERPEAVAAGTVRLVGTNSDRIVLEAERLLTDRSAYEQMAKARNPYGDGTASTKIVDAIKDHFRVG